jgi:hypothetical protein
MVFIFSDKSLPSEAHFNFSFFSAVIVKHLGLVFQNFLGSYFTIGIVYSLISFLLWHNIHGLAKFTVCHNVQFGAINYLV